MKVGDLVNVSPRKAVRTTIAGARLDRTHGGGIIVDIVDDALLTPATGKGAAKIYYHTGEWRWVSLSRIKLISEGI